MRNTHKGGKPKRFHPQFEVLQNIFDKQSEDDKTWKYVAFQFVSIINELTNAVGKTNSSATRAGSS